MWKDGQKGFNIRIHFSAENLNGVVLRAVASFYTNSGATAVYKNSSTNEQIRVTKNIIPDHQSTSIREVIFVPYDKITKNGYNILKFQVSIYKGNKPLEISSTYFFSVY